eukprot:9796252-Alexandrium_andersonii.AAC.1
MSFRSSHPWLTPRCVELIRRKCAAAGTDNFRHAAEACSAGLLHAFHLHVTRMREQLRRLPRGSKRWWRISRELLSKISKPASPALRLPDGSWAVQAHTKANALADAFVSKW